MTTHQEIGVPSVFATIDGDRYLRSADIRAINPNPERFAELHSILGEYAPASWSNQVVIIRGPGDVNMLNTDAASCNQEQMVSVTSSETLRTLRDATFTYVSASRIIGPSPIETAQDITQPLLMPERARIKRRAVGHIAVSGAVGGALAVVDVLFMSPGIMDTGLTASGGVVAWTYVAYRGVNAAKKFAANTRTYNKAKDVTGLFDIEFTPCPPGHYRSSYTIH